MKTITELNSKWWYRLVKVGFLGFVLLCMIIAIVLVNDSHSPREVSDYKVECIADYTNHKTFYADKDKDIYIYQSYGKTVYESLSEYSRKDLREACDISEEEADDATSKAIAYITEQEELGASSASIQKYLDENMRPYRLTEDTVTKGSYFAAIFYSLLSIIGIAVVAEIIRRVFYYILLGTLRPTK